MNRAHDPTLEVPTAHVFSHATFIGAAGGPKWERMFDRELMIKLGDVVGVAIEGDSDAQVRSEPNEHYMCTNVERIVRLHDNGDTLVQFITFEECAPPMTDDAAPIDTTKPFQKET